MSSLVSTNAVQARARSRSRFHLDTSGAPCLSAGVRDSMRMKKVPILLLVTILVAGCSNALTPTDAPGSEAASAPPTPANYPIVLIDEQHQIQGSNTPAGYQIPAGVGIR